MCIPNIRKYDINGHMHMSLRLPILLFALLFICPVGLICVDTGVAAVLPVKPSIQVVRIEPKVDLKPIVSLDMSAGTQSMNLPDPGILFGGLDLGPSRLANQGPMISLQTINHAMLLPLTFDEFSHAVLMPVLPETLGDTWEMERTLPIAGELALELRRLLDAEAYDAAHEVLLRAFDAERANPHSGVGLPEHGTSKQKHDTDQFDLYRTMQTRWISDDQYEGQIKSHYGRNGPHIGELPKELGAFFSSREQALKVLDTIAGDLMPHRGVGASWTKKKPIEEVNKEIAPLSVSYINKGEDSVVYKLQAGEHAFALKLYMAMNVGEEFRALTFLRAQGAKDIMKSYAAKLLASDSRSDEVVTWILSEFIPATPPLSPKEFNQRGSSTIAEIARKNNIFLGYSHDRVNSILVDAGFILLRSDLPKEISDFYFNSALQSSASWINLMETSWDVYRRSLKSNRKKRLR